ncbi:unnamed protein product [Cyclocybe aegerita]|uniref:Uncharacterized protein n=1 Tax=Cyclocybe aegerita TaxID=1973307 RepID=A0A8S0WFX4_CYCAE|nr:unnamed protein product [Cyclocybe aegerita]
MILNTAYAFRRCANIKGFVERQVLQKASLSLKQSINLTADMIFNASKILVALTAAAAASASALPEKRQVPELATCDFVLQPDRPVDSSPSNFFAEFNYVIGRSFAIERWRHRLW